MKKGILLLFLIVVIILIITSSNLRLLANNNSNKLQKISIDTNVLVTKTHYFSNDDTNWVMAQRDSYKYNGFAVQIWHLNEGRGYITGDTNYNWQLDSIVLNDKNWIIEEYWIRSWLDDTTSSKNLFDERGRLIEQSGVEYFYNYINKYYYDDYNNIIEHSYIEYNKKNNNIMNETVTRYNIQNNKLNSIYIYPSMSDTVPYFRTLYTYQDNYNYYTIAQNKKDSVWQDTTKIVYKNDGNMRPILIIGYAWSIGNWQEHERIILNYDDQGRMIHYLNTTGGMPHETDSTFDNLGNLVEYYNLDTPGETHTFYFYINNQLDSIYSKYPAYDYPYENYESSFDKLSYENNLLKSEHLSYILDWDVPPRKFERIDYEYTHITSVEERPVSNENISIYPIPASTQFKIQFNELYTEPVAISIFNSLGVEVYSNVYNEVSNNGVSIDTREMPTGTYFCRFVSGRKADTRKFVLIK